MSQEQVLKTLIDLGLTRLDSQVYIYLAKKGPQKGQEISKGLKIQKQQLYRSLKNLQGKGIVESSLKHPAQFSAVSFDKVVDIFVKAKMAEANRIQENKEEILASWKALAVGETPDASAKFTIIEGRGPIYSRILQMVKETKNSLSSISTVTDLVRADQFGLFNAGISHPLKEKIKFRLLTETSKHDAKTLQRLIHEVSNQKINIEARTPGISLNLFSYIVIRDDEEIISVITPRNEQTVAQEEACLWTNCKPLVQTFLAVFENLWSNSQNVVEKTKELETETTAPETYTINNAQTASRKYEEILRFAQREIIMMTSPQGLNDLSTKTNLLRDLANRGVSIKVMSTIKSENLAASQQLLEYCNIKHVPNSYMNNTIVDGLHLFQFRNMPSNKQETDAFSMYENAFYTSDLSQIEKTKNILNDIWKKASSPSPVTLESLIGPYGSGPSPLAGTQWKKLGNNLIIEEKHGSVTEKDVLNKIINAKKLPVKDPSRDVNRMYASSATAIIHPPDYFNLPDMLIHIDHIEKQSSLGQGDALEVHLRSETSEGPV
ncbi:MAG TPA: helix-turn-helix domain-containing protein, partial [Candidatus Nanoarchaeia archaeon]|nr:helix-turn-helix domain-containing protein [Candidatus Nanoarchaeia archaeon]